MNKDPLVSIVIPTYNRNESVLRLIKSLLTNTYKNIEIIIIDDHSKDNTFELVKNTFKGNKKVKIFRNNRNLFAAGSKNVGQKKAKGEFIAFIDDDNLADKNLIKNFVEVFIKNPDFGELGPINYNFNNKKAILHTSSTRSMWTTKTKHMRTLEPFKNKQFWEVDDIPNAFIVRADVVKKHKIEFRKEYGIMYEESDYAYRIRNAGYKIVMVRDAKVYHDIEDKSGKEKPKDYLYHFMEDSRRPFTFARNRIIFHSIYSTRLQNMVIMSFWIWFFLAYYFYKFLFYNGFGSFSKSQKINACRSYFMGTINGLKIVLNGNYYEKI